MLTHLCDFALDAGQPESDGQETDAKHSPRNGPIARDNDKRRACEEYEHSEDASNVSLAVIHRSRAGGSRFCLRLSMRPDHTTRHLLEYFRHPIHGKRDYALTPCLIRDEEHYVPKRRIRSNANNPARVKFRFPTQGSRLRVQCVQ